jgi:hypothetical protein
MRLKSGVTHDNVSGGYFPDWISTNANIPEFFLEVNHQLQALTDSLGIPTIYEMFKEQSESTGCPFYRLPTLSQIWLPLHLESIQATNSESNSVMIT